MLRKALATVRRAVTNLLPQDTGYRAASETHDSVKYWQPPMFSSDRMVLRDGGKLRARARDLHRNNPFATNAVRMRNDAVVGSGLKLTLKPDFRALGIDIQVASDWADAVTREWEAYSEGVSHAADAKRKANFSTLMRIINTTMFVDGESLAIVETKKGIGTPYRTCLNLINVDRLCNPMGTSDTHSLRGGIELDPMGEPLAYYIRDSHPSDYWMGGNLIPAWRKVVRQTKWGRPVVLHSFDGLQPEMTRGVSEFAAAVVPMRMHGQYSDMELQSAIVHAMYTAVIETDLDYDKAANVLGADRARTLYEQYGGNPLTAMTLDHLKQVAPYYREAGITMDGVKVPHLLPNEKLELKRSEHPNSNFGPFDTSFIRQFAAALGVESHELAKNYAEVNYSAARAALAAVWRTYLCRRDFIVENVAMPFFTAWLEEAIAIGTVGLPKGVPSFLAWRPQLCRGKFIAWGKPIIDPVRERKGLAMGLAMGVDTLESACADDGYYWRDVLDQRAEEAAYRDKLGLEPEDLNFALVEAVPPGTMPDRETD